MKNEKGKRVGCLLPFYYLQLYKKNLCGFSSLMRTHHLLMVNMTATVKKMCSLLLILYSCNTWNPLVKHIKNIHSEHFGGECSKWRQRCFVAWWAVKQRVNVQIETDEQAVCTSINTGVFTSYSPVSCEPFAFIEFHFLTVIECNMPAGLLFDPQNVATHVQQKNLHIQSCKVAVVTASVTIFCFDFYTL